MNQIKVGLFGVGLDTYWSQFDGLLERLTGYQREICEKIEAMDVEVIDAGMVDNPTKASAAASKLKSEGVEIIFLYVSTYALSSTVLPVAQQAGVPVIILNLQPVAAIDYAYINAMGDRGKMTGEWLAHCQACSLPEFACIFNRSGIKYDVVTGYLQQVEAWQQIEEWVEAAKVCQDMRFNRMGILGHYYCGMLDVYTDITMQSATFGTHVELLEMCKLKELRDRVSRQELDEKIEEFSRTFDVTPECDEAELERAARTSVALDKLVAEYNLGSLAYYYEGAAGNDYENIVTSIIAGNTLLTGKGIPVAGIGHKAATIEKIASLLGIGYKKIC